MLKNIFLVSILLLTITTKQQKMESASTSSKKSTETIPNQKSRELFLKLPMGFGSSSSSGSKGGKKKKRPPNEIEKSLQEAAKNAGLAEAMKKAKGLTNELSPGAILKKLNIMPPSTFKVPMWTPLKGKKKGMAECLLSLEAYPFYYVSITRSSNFRLKFASNCLIARDINFEVYYNMTKFINFNYHPTTVILNLWGNKYKLVYTRPKIVDRYDVMRSIEYQRVSIKNLLTDANDMFTRQTNFTMLDPQKKDTFNTFNIRKIAQTKGSVRCKTKIVRPFDYIIKKIMSREKKKFFAKKKKRRLKQMNPLDKMEEAVKGKKPRELKEVKERNLRRKKRKKRKKRSKEYKNLRLARQGMLLLLSKNSIKEIIIECKIS